MDSLFCCSSVYDTGASLFTRPASLVSHLPSIFVHPMALTTPDFLVSFVRYPPTVLISSKFSWCISCDAIPTRQRQLNPVIEEMRERRHNAMKQFLLKECCLSSSQIELVISKEPSLFRRKSTDRAHEVLKMFRDSRFTIEQVRKTNRNPSVLVRSVDDHLKPKIEYLKTLGIAEGDVNHVISRDSRILTRRLDETLPRRILSRIKFFGSKALKGHLELCLIILN